MSGEATVLLWWFLFGGTHVFGSVAAVRGFLIERLGTQGFKGAYSLVALATFVPLCWVYAANKHVGVLIFQPAPSFAVATELLMIVAIVVLGQALATPSPITTAAEMSGQFPASPRGIQRVTRHPMNLAFAVFGVAHILSNPFASDWVFFGGFVAYAVVSSIHQDKRTAASGREEIREFQAATSWVPFGAIVTGRQRLALGEYSTGALAVSLGVVALLWYFHSSLFGGAG